MTDTWEASEPQNLSSILMPGQGPSHDLTPRIEAVVFDMHFQGQYLPHRVWVRLCRCGRCRMKMAHDTHRCVMANYAHAHEVPEPENTLREGGLIGAFILDQGQIRCLSCSEMIMLDVDIVVQCRQIIR